MGHDERGLQGVTSPEIVQVYQQLAGNRQVSVALEVLLWVAGLAIALYASERLVHYLVVVGRELRISPGLLGLLVACGADAPEVTSALVAVVRGSSDVGLGVVVGSNIYNLAGLLGLAAITAGSLSTDRYLLSLDGGANVLLMLGLAGLVMAPALHRPIGALLIVLLLAYALVSALPRRRVLRLVGLATDPSGTEPQEIEESPGESQSMGGAIAFAFVSMAFIVIGSFLLVNESILLGRRMSVPDSIIGTFVLAIATSLPNTWAALSLARRGLGASAVATTFNSNSINAALGAGLPSLVLTLHVSSAVRSLDAPWLLGMTLVAIALLASGWSIRRVEGSILVAIYAAFVAVRLLVIH